MRPRHVHGMSTIDVHDVHAKCPPSGKPWSGRWRGRTDGPRRRRGLAAVDRNAVVKSTSRGENQMPRQITTEPKDHHYRVRGVMRGGAILHLASDTEPERIGPPLFGAGEWTAKWLDDPDKGDTIGFINWTEVVAVTWRWLGLRKEGDY